MSVRNMFGITFKGSSELNSLVNLSKLAENLGFGACWIAEDYFWGGAFSIATACALKTSSLHIGIGVINPYTRHPALSAMEAAVVNKLSQNRFLLGMGASSKYWIEKQMAIEYKSPLASVYDSVQIIRDMLTGRTVYYQGSVHSIFDAQLEIDCAGRVPIYLGVKGEKSLQLAGEIGDGVLLSTGTSLPYLNWAKEQLAIGAAKAGRSLENYNIGAYLLISIDKDRRKAKEAIKDHVARVVGQHGIHPIMTLAGLQDQELNVFRDAFLKRQKVGHLVTEEMLDAFSISGTPEECQHKLRQYLDAGLTHPILTNTPNISLVDNMNKVKDYLLPLIIS